MREVTAIDPKWLVEFAPAFFKFGDPTKLSKRKKQERIEPLYNRWALSVYISYNHCMCVLIIMCTDMKRLILGEFQNRRSGNKTTHTHYYIITLQVTFTDCHLSIVHNVKHFSYHNIQKLITTSSWPLARFFARALLDTRDHITISHQVVYTYGPSGPNHADIDAREWRILRHEKCHHLNNFLSVPH